MSEFTGDMGAAVEAAFTAASTPDASTTTTTESASASTTETPVEDVSQEAAVQPETTTTQEPGPIPYQRFKEVNDKYTTASKELEGYGWAKGVNPQLAQSAIQLLTKAQGNPLKAFTDELEVYRDHPEIGPQLRSWAARTLGFGNRPRQDIPVQDVMPEPDVQFEDGRKTYSDQQLQKRDQWLMRQMESKFDERLAPLAKKTQAADQFVAEQIWERESAKAQVTAGKTLDSLRKQYPQFEEHEPDVKELMLSDDRITLEQAWHKVFVEKVGPKLASGQAAAVRQKVNAGSANPSRPSGAAPTAAKDFHEELTRLLG